MIEISLVLLGLIAGALIFALGGWYINRRLDRLDPHVLPESHVNIPMPRTKPTFGKRPS